jgi:ribonuclease P protein component
LQRIRHRAQFDAVLAGAPLVKTAHFALHMAVTESHADATGLFPGGGLWLGVLIPKRWARRAVTRNTLRRQIYAVSQELVRALPGQALVVRLRSGFDRQQFVSATSVALKAQARAELLQLLGSKLQLRLAAAAPVVRAAQAGGTHAV